MRLASAFLLGVVFAIGLGIGGMTQPSKVIGFLDVSGSWDPSLLLVMGGAVAVSFVLFARILTRERPLLEERFFLPEEVKRIDAALVGGAALFGVGWGLSGYCPGPALVSIVRGTPAIIAFVATMLVGMQLGDWWSRHR